MKVLLAITRWTDRTPHNNYLRTLEQLRTLPSEIEPVIFSHGDQIDQYSIPCDTIDYSDKFGGRFPPLAREAMLEAVSGNYGGLILFDDDAFVGDWPHFLAQCANADQSGSWVTGPFNTLRLWMKYKREIPTPRGYFKSPPWTTLGSQFYNVDFLKETQGIWDPMMKPLKFRMDFPFFMMAHSMGGSPSEFFEPSYNHSCSGGSWKGHDDNWYRARVAAITQDYEILHRSLSVLKGYEDFYRKQIDRVGKYELGNCNNKVKKAFPDLKLTTYEELMGC